VDNPTVDDIIVDEYEVDNVAYNFRMFNNFKVTKDLSLSAFGFYRGKGRNLQFTIDPMYFVNIGARYSLWEGRGTFSINYNDIFDTMKFAFEGELPYAQVGQFNWESNSIYVGLSYPTVSMLDCRIVSEVENTELNLERAETIERKKVAVARFRK
jgi:hypothetical protein